MCHIVTFNRKIACGCRITRTRAFDLSGVHMPTIQYGIALGKLGMG